MDFEEIFKQRESRRTKQMIQPERIDKIRKIELELFDDEEQELLQQSHKELLYLAMNKNNSNEVGFLISLVDWRREIIYGSESGLTLRDNDVARDMLISAPKNSLVFLHNHPKNRVFSEQDLESFFAADGLLMVSVVCNNGNQYYLTKLDTFDKNFALERYNEVFDKAGEGNGVKEFLRCSRDVGLEFRYGGV